MHVVMNIGVNVGTVLEKLNTDPNVQADEAAPYVWGHARSRNLQ